MGKVFLSIRRKYRLIVALFIALSSPALGMTAASVYVLFEKLGEREPSVVSALVIGAAVSLAAAGVLLIVYLPTDKRVARRMDRRMKLEEKVSTMVAFRAESTDMILMQRSDTEKALAKSRGARALIGNLWVCLVAFALAVGVTVTAAAVPVGATEPPVAGGGEEDEAWALTDWHITAIRALIEDVKGSAMADSGKADTVALLERLISDLGYVDTVSAMKRTVIACMVDIDKVADRLNSFSAIIKSILSSENARVKQYAEALGSLSDPIVESKYQELKISFAYEGISESVYSFARGIETAVGLSGVTESDTLYLALTGLCDELMALSPALSDMDEAGARAALSGCLDKSAEGISVILGAQYVNRSVATDTVNELMLIFGIARAELPDELKYSDDAEAGTTGGDYSEKDDKVITDGGKGSGEVIYGSDDAIYDPERDEHVSYGDVLAKYDAIKSSELDERNMPDWLKEFILKYFEDLYYGNDDN